VNENSKPIAPYLAVGLSTVVHGVAERKHIRRNLAVVEDGIHAAMRSPKGR
jgi:beta-ureidopropionase